MAEPQEVQTAVMRAARSPRSAAAAGILFSVLMATSMILLTNAAVLDPVEINRGVLDTLSPNVSVALTLVPFAGIAFLWFTGVLRDLLGDLEDKFFATVFLGSGIVLVAMMFVWAAAFGAMVGTYQSASDTPKDLEVLIYAASFSSRIIGDFFLRMASVYMLSIGSLWTRTRVVPRWLSIVTYVVGIAFLLFAGALRWSRFMFPAWVLLVSVYILILNYRRAFVRGST